MSYANSDPSSPSQSAAQYSLDTQCLSNFSRPWLVGVIACLLLIQFALIFRVSANWDEYNELAILFASDTGFTVFALRHGLHYFFWPIRFLEVSEYALLSIARVLTFVVGTIGIYRMVYVLAARAAPASIERREFGLLSVLFVQTTTTFFESSIQFRTDQFITLLFLIGLGQVLRPGGMQSSRRNDLIAGAVLGLAMFINPKAIYHAAALLAVVLVQARQSRRELRLVLWQLARIGFVGGAFFSILIVTHMLNYGLSFAALPEHVGDVALTGFGRTHSWSTKKGFISMLWNRSFLQVLSLPIGYGLILIKLFPQRFRSPELIQLATAGLILLLSILIHQGTYRYFILDILVPSAIVGSLGLSAVVDGLLNFARLKHSKRQGAVIKMLVTGALAILLCLGILQRLPWLAENTRITQWQSERVLTNLFPKLATASKLQYLDGFSAFARSNNAVGFWSHKRSVRYLYKGDSRLTNALSQAPAAFINFSLLFAMRQLKASEKKLVENNYVPLISGLWVHGFRPHRRGKNKPATFYTRIAGTYSLSGRLDDCSIDGVPARPQMNLAVGKHIAACKAGSYVSEIVLGDFRERMSEWIISIPAGQVRNVRNFEPIVYFDAREAKLTDLDCVASFDSADLKLPDAQSQKVLNDSGIFIPAGNFRCLNRGSKSLRLSPLGPFFFWAGKLQN